MLGAKEARRINQDILIHFCMPYLSLRLSDEIDLPTESFFFSFLPVLTIRALVISYLPFGLMFVTFTKVEVVEVAGDTY
jgi:hypothetical protein